MSKVLVDISNEYGYTITGVEGEGLDVGGCALTAPGVTAEELHRIYDKRVTMKVDGISIGFAGISSAVQYIKKVEKNKKVTDITYWGVPEALYYLKLRYALTNDCAGDLLWTKKDQEVWPTLREKQEYLSRVMGQKVGKSINKYKLTCKPSTQ